MSTYLKRPLNSTILVLFFFLLFAKVSPILQGYILPIFLTGSVFLSSIIIHELGHVVFGLLAGLRFEFFVVGPIKVIRREKRVRVVENKSWSLYGGVACMVHTEYRNINDLKKSHFWFVLGGMLNNLIFSILALLFYFYTDYNWLIVFAIVNFMSAALSVIPTKGSELISDGLRLKKLNQGEDEFRGYLISVQIGTELFIKESASEWDIELIKQAEMTLECSPELDTNIHIIQALIYYYLIEKHWERGKKYASPYLSKNTSQNKLISQDMFDANYLILLMLGKDLDNHTHIKNIISRVSDKNQLSYYKAQIVLYYILGEKEEAFLILEKALIHVKENEEYALGRGYEQSVLGLVREFILKNSGSGANT
ncbi:MULTISPECIES: M50 family metallopeptidase [Bacillus]|uniref:M50 family metallopeptidase n=1 Tax=Bacillus TaxID=1386 RepID=UPI000D040DA8|nr:MULTISPECIES: M50 family metallopeptidase [Bacillus]MBR9656978.1 hypothetical protein [Bacillus cereus]MCU4899379.1 M50 family metallopeptidase [Bacillus cereus]MCU5313886.1 M50 family metallopeptidase [Bacillus cereus]MCU5438864.1 M50 family metallopeptidase [Bacillus cereus]MCU5483509.1 M50 family metallopeptidase [Bacillus cereus]